MVPKNLMVSQKLNRKEISSDTLKSSRTIHALKDTMFSKSEETPNEQVKILSNSHFFL